MAYNKETGMYEGYIYTIKNKINNHMYIGQTTRTPQERWYEHTKSSSLNGKRKKALQNAINKYGVDNFEFKVLETICELTTDILKNKLDNLEIYYISYYNTHSKTGYNLTDGGDNVAPDNKCSIGVDVYTRDGKYIDFCKSMAYTSKKYNISISSISQCCNGYLPHAKDYIFRIHGECFEKYEVISKNNKIPVYQFDKLGDLINHFDSITEASKTLNIPHSNISYALNKKNKSCGGYIWSTTKDFQGYDIIPKGVNMYSLDGQFIKFYKQLYLVKEDGFNVSGVHGVCNKRCKTHKGYCFYYANDPNQPDKTKIISNETVKEIS